MALPLEGIRILDLSVVIALPLGTGLMADMGAEVIRIDPCSRLDTRSGGPQPDNKNTEHYWNSAGNFNWMHRGKKSFALNLSTPEGLEVFGELVKVSDVVCDNFTREVMGRWGYDYEGLRIKPDIIALSNTGWGHTGPWRDYPGLAQAVECVTSLANYTGYRGGPPARVGQNYFDTTCANNIALAVMAALVYRERTGKGQFIDHSMYEACAPNAAEGLLEYQMTGRKGERWGSRNPSFAPQGTYPCAGNDRWIVIGITNDDEWDCLVEAMGSPEWAKAPALSTAIGRRDAHDMLDERIADWTKDKDSIDLMNMLQAMGVPAGAVLTGKDFLLDPHIKARGYFETIEHPEPALGKRPYAGRPFKSSLNDYKIHAAPLLGEHNEYILKELLGHDDAFVKEMYEKDVIGTQPLGEAPPRPERPLEFQVQIGNYSGFDTDYKAKLGI